jgi:hypothetical protein
VVLFWRNQAGGAAVCAAVAADDAETGEPHPSSWMCGGVPKKTQGEVEVGYWGEGLLSGTDTIYVDENLRRNLNVECSRLEEVC